MEKNKLITVPEAVEVIKAGKMIIIVDDEHRENEGDLMIASEKITPEAVNFMATHGKGLICVSLTKARSEELDLPLMVHENTSNFETPFTISVDVKQNTTTGISAYDRSETIKALIDNKKKASDFAKPGHIFPLVAKKGGVLARAGQTEASLDISRIAGLYPSGVICEIMNEDGSMSRMKDLQKFSSKFDIPILTTEELIKYKVQKDTVVKKISEAVLPTKWGEFTIKTYIDEINNETHIALTRGNVNTNEPTLVNSDL